MAAYAGVTTVLWSISLGGKRAALIKVRVTNYNATGIPFSPHQVGMAYIEGVFLGAPPSLDDGNAPIAIAYDPTLKVCLLYSAADTPVANDTNIYSAIGDLILLVVGS